MTSHPEITAEQGHVDRAYARLAALRDRARTLAAGVVRLGAGGTHQARFDRDVFVETSARRLAALEVGQEPLVFGRLDLHDGGHVHIGRVAVADAAFEPLVLDWRAPAAASFYRATGAEPLGVTRRRHIRCRGRQVVDLDDELLAESAGGELALVGEAALLTALDRRRTGTMRDIVATIQREQDEVVRAPLEGVLVVQGGPGTGKTAVALHRAAYLLYTHRGRLDHGRVLLVGPTPGFLRAIGEVLPSLGEDSVRLGRLADLPGLPPVGAADAHEAAVVKADGRMAAVLARVARHVRGRARGGEAPPLLARAVVRQLFASPRRLRHAAAGILTDAEQALLVRPTDAAWSADDLALLDELAACLTTDEEASTFAHVLVDEAQELTPMQWRMLTRRCPSRSMTIVGDLGQAGGVWTPGSWEDVARLLVGARGRSTIRALTVNYRTPAEIMEWAGTMLAVTTPALGPPRSVRRTGAHPEVERVERSVLPGTLAATVAGLVEAGGTVAVVAPSAMAAAVRQWAGGHAVVHTVEDVRGLEFDSVVVVEPAAIVEERGLRGLYVACTRPTQRLTVLHTRGLPAGCGQSATRTESSTRWSVGSPPATGSRLRISTMTSSRSMSSRDSR
ncbi:MAG: UvrD-helicase domain-containing protein [Egibacteraceae bacterium]